MEDLVKDISTVIAKNYSPESLSDFFAKYTFVSLFEVLHDEGSDLTEQFLSRFSNFMATVFKTEKYADDFLFNNSVESKQILGYVATHKELEIRQLIPFAIRHHIPKITGILEKCDDKTFDENFGALFKLLDDETTEVGLKALDVILKIVKESKPSGYLIAKKQIFIEYLEKGLRNVNSVVMMRYIDLLIEITNLSEELFELYRTKGLMEHMIKAYETDDVLVKLTVVEAIPKMGDSPWNSKFINETLVQKSMMEECFDENADFYIRKNIAVLIAKLIARGLISMNNKVKGLFSGMFKNWLLSGFKEELYGVLDIIANLVVRQSGVEVLFLNEEALVAFYSLSLKTDAELKKKFLFAFSQIFSEEIDKKLSAWMKKAFALIGHIEPIFQMKKEVSEVPTTSFDQSFKWLLKVLHAPFVDIEQEALVVLRNVLRFEWSIMDFARQDNSLAYILEHHAKSKEILDLKREIIKEVVQRIDQSQTKDIFLLDFKNKLVAGKSGMKGPSDKTTYATEVL